MADPHALESMASQDWPLKPTLIEYRTTMTQDDLNGMIRLAVVARRERPSPNQPIEVIGGAAKPEGMWGRGMSYWIGSEADAIRGGGQTFGEASTRSFRAFLLDESAGVNPVIDYWALEEVETDRLPTESVIARTAAQADLSEARPYQIGRALQEDRQERAVCRFLELMFYRQHEPNEEATDIDSWRSSAEFLLRSPDLPRPGIVLTRTGEVSFEWELQDRGKIVLVFQGDKRIRYLTVEPKRKRREHGVGTQEDVLARVNKLSHWIVAR